MFVRALSVSYILCIYLLLEKNNFSYSKLQTNSCDFHVTVIRHTENEGFHRELHSLVELVAGRSHLRWDECTLALEETIPSGLFVNPDQLADLARLGKMSAQVNTSVDTEQPERLSPGHSVTVYSALTPTENLFSAQICLPIHARYHEPQPGGGHRSASLKSPRLLLRCPGDECSQYPVVSWPCRPHSNATCLWRLLPFTTNARVLNVLVPVGDTNHSVIVTLLTLLITSGGCIYILSVLAGTWPLLV